MPVLLLAQGDKPTKDLLRSAIEARYGLRPPALESLHLDFKGRARARLGPVSTWIPVDITAWFKFPTAMRWDFVVRAVGVQISSGIESFDGTNYRRTRGGKTSTLIAEPDLIQSTQSRLWAIAAVLLTPLGDHFVKLETTGANQLQATHTQINSAVTLQLRPDHSLDYVEVSCLNPDTAKQQLFTLRLSQEQAPINELMLPSKISAFWDDAPYFEVEPVLAESNPDIPAMTFALS
jgi:hypothetical protein